MRDHGAPWVVLDYATQPPELRCLRCGGHQVLTLPAAVDQVVAVADGFTSAHRNCKEKP